MEPLNNDNVFLVDSETWSKLPWSGWTINKSGYVSCCGVPLHQVVAYLNGIEFRRDTVIDHKNRNKLDNRLENLRPCTAIENGWNSEKRHGHQLKNGKWRFTFRRSTHTRRGINGGSSRQESTMGSSLHSQTHIRHVRRLWTALLQQPMVCDGISSRCRRRTSTPPVCVFA